MHCVTTAWLELARNAPIGQEFELVVPNDLEFQLTLNVKLEKPPPQRIPASPTKAAKPKASTFEVRWFDPDTLRARMQVVRLTLNDDERYFYNKLYSADSIVQKKKKPTTISDFAHKGKAQSSARARKEVIDLDDDEEAMAAYG